MLSIDSQQLHAVRLDNLAPLVADSSYANFTTDTDTLPISFGKSYFVGPIDYRRNFITRQKPPIKDPQLHMTISFEQKMEVKKNFKIVNVKIVLFVQK